uniref:Zinc finger protein n=1 Tax=Mesocestoides corti TaxID=53468 RepID=A0A5K3FAN3_MESCO
MVHMTTPTMQTLLFTCKVGARLFTLLSYYVTHQKLLSCCLEATEQFTDNDSFPVELDSAFSMAPVEIVDLNACPEACGEATNLPSFTWSNTDDGLYPDSAAMDIDGQRYRSTWLQPISLFTNHPDSQGGGEMPAVDEAFPSNADVNL